MNFALHIIDECLAQGITRFCIAPGARSTPLIVALSHYQLAQTYIHFDERGLAFFALGLAKKDNLPVAIITTSGSAVGNLMPALMEADNAHIPLILITADRPFELKGCGANQTTDQVKIFETFVRYHIDLPASDTHLSFRSMRQKVAHAIFSATHSRRGPVHINCRFREPFLPLTPFVKESLSVQYTQETSLPSPFDLQVWKKGLAACKKGVILAGADAFLSGSEELLTLACKLGWPILADPLSGVRSASTSTALYYNYFLKDPSLASPGGILHFGDRFVSKPLLQWIEACAPPFYGLISPHPHHHDPLHSLTHRQRGCTKLFCSEISKHILPARDHTYLREWQRRSLSTKTTIDHFFDKHEPLSEPGLIHFLSSRLPPSWSLFVANSMPIRDVDSLFFPEKPLHYLTANRGVSGIDGNIATALGCADIAILGDLAALHDINSLALIHQRKKPIILLIINNQGGGIFSFLPLGRERHESFETHFAAAHTYSFKEAAALFHIPYANPQSKAALERHLLASFKHPQTTLIEINTNREENHALHQTLSELCYPTS